MPFLVGVDVGATNTALLAVDDADAVVVERRLPGAYLPDVGEEAFAQLLAAVRDVLRDLPASDLRVVFGLPGHGDITDLTRRHVELLGRLYPDVRHRAYNDVYLALVGAHLGAPGIVALSGTGSMALGRNSAGHLDRLGGLGPILGDEGSAYAIALHALRVAALANDRRARATSLVDATLRHFGVGEVAEVTLQLMNHAQARARLASFAREVDACARDGDRAALAVLRGAASELAHEVAWLRRRLGEALPVAWVGSTFQSDTFRAAFVNRLGQYGVQDVRPPLSAPERGGVLLARQLGDEVAGHIPASLLGVRDPAAPTDGPAPPDARRRRPDG